MRKRSRQVCSDLDLDLSQRVGGACRSLCFLHRLGKVAIGAAVDHQRCHTDLISILENLCGFEARLPACHLQIGRGLPNIQPPVDLSCCQQSWAVPAPVDLWALICGQKDACTVIVNKNFRFIIVKTYCINSFSNELLFCCRLPAWHKQIYFYS